jgi:hypothetical protein
MRRLLSSKDLHWLKIDEYDKAAELDLVGWHNALTFRFILRGHLEGGHQLPNHLSDMVLSLLVTPFAGGTDVLSKKLLLDKYTELVYDFNVFDGIEAVDLKSPRMEGISEQYARWLAWIDRSEDFSDEPESEWPDLRRPLHEVMTELTGRPETTRKIWVDLAAPDDLILKSFANWLKVARGSIGIKRAQLVVDSAELERWNTYRVLAYIDLQLYALLARREITAAVAGAVLFPLEEVDSAERIRKVVKPLADKIMTGLFIEALGRQAQLSRAEPEGQC